MCLAASILIFAPTSFFCFSAAGLMADVDLSSCFLGVAIFLVAVISGRLGTSVTG